MAPGSVIQLSQEQFNVLLNGHIEIRAEQKALRDDLRAHIDDEEAFLNSLAGRFDAVQATQNLLVSEQKANAESMQLVADMMEAGKAVVTVASWIKIGVKSLAAFFIGGVALLVAIKTVLVQSDQSLLGWLQDWWRGR